MNLGVDLVKVWGYIFNAARAQNSILFGDWLLFVFITYYGIASEQ